MGAAPSNGVRNDPPELTVLPVTELGPRGRAAVIRLCGDALGVDCADLFDYLTDTTHVLAHIGDRLVGHCCWWDRTLVPAGVRPLRTAWVDAVTVAPSDQRRGIGSVLMRRLDELTAAFDLRALGTERMAFFERLGWELWNGRAKGVLHDPADTLMVLRTTATLGLDTALPINAR